MNRSIKDPASRTLTEALRELISKGIAHTQEDLKQNLQSQGFEVNQSKISRLLRKIGAFKTTSANGEVVYQLPFEPEPPSFDSTVHHLVVEILRNEFVVVVCVSPGSASLIARVIDYHAEKIGSLASVAGDDTILVVPRSIKSIEDTYQKVRSLLIE